MLSKNWMYYVVTLLLFLALKAGYQGMDNDDLLFLLTPTNALVACMHGSDTVYSSAQGYYYPDLHITIEKSCAGFNFWLISFMLLVLVSLQYLNSTRSKAMMIPTALLLSLGATILVNASRINVSILANAFTMTYQEHQISWLHQAEGAFIYLLFLILFYFGSHLLFTKFYPRHEKLA